MIHRFLFLFLILLTSVFAEAVSPVFAQKTTELYVSLEMDLSTALTSNPPRITFTAKTDRNDLHFDWQEKSDYTGYLQSNQSDTAYYTLEGDNRDTGVTITVTVTDPEGNQASAQTQFQTARITEKLEAMRKNQGRTQDVESWQAKHEALEQMLFSHIRAYEESRNEGPGAVEKTVRRVQDIVDELNAIEAHCKRFPGLPGEVQEIRDHYLAQKKKWTAELAQWKQGADAVQAESELLDLTEEWRRQHQSLETALEERIQAYDKEQGGAQDDTRVVAEIRTILEAIDQLEQHCDNSPVKDRETDRLLKKYSKLKKKWQTRLEARMAKTKMPEKPETPKPSSASLPQKTAEPEPAATQTEALSAASPETVSPATAPTEAEIGKPPVRKHPARKRQEQKLKTPKKKSGPPNYKMLEDSVGVPLN